MNKIEKKRQIKKIEKHDLFHFDKLVTKLLQLFWISFLSIFTPSDKKINSDSDTTIPNVPLF
jgi:hypothetical protein